MVTGSPGSTSRWPADVASFVAGVLVPAIVLAVAEAVTVVTVLLLVAWMVVPVHAGGRVLADVRHGLACWSASRMGARHARRAARNGNITNITERGNQASFTRVTHKNDNTA